MSKQKRLIIVFAITVSIIFFLTDFVNRKYCVPIIMYHSVSPVVLPKNRIHITANTFERQMRFLKIHNYNVLPLESIVTLMKEKKKIPPKTVAITFDDGYKNIYNYAFPILKKYNLPANIFIIVGEIGRSQSDRLSWEEVGIMLESGIISVGSHAIIPEPLVKIKSEEEQRKQIFDSKRIIEGKLGSKVNIFSYSEGMFDAKIRRLVMDAGYLAAVATNPGASYPNNDIFALKRIRISENASNMFIFAVETSGLYTFFKEYKKSRKK